LTAAAPPASEPWPGAGGDWPRTTRVLPWLIAAFVAMLWLVPFDDVELRVPMPIDPLLDRFALGLLALLWAVSLISRQPGRPRLRPLTRVDVAIGAFLLIAVASVVVNIERISIHDELQPATKAIVLLLSFFLFFAVVSTTLRPAELRNFAILIVGLASVTAVGVIWEYRTGTNLFYDWTRSLAPPGFDIGNEVSDPRWGRRSITGPTGHPLAAAAILALALPFAVTGLVESKRRHARLLYALAIAAIFIALMSTLRKTAMFAPAAALLVLLFYRPRAMLRLLPLGIALVLAVQVVAPGALGSIRKQVHPERLEQAGTFQDRVADYDAIRPDIRAHPAFGRGYGTYAHDKYRLLDNQYLGILIGTGYVGFAAYIALWIGTIGVAGRAARSRDPGRASPALAVSAAAAAFGTAAALFDVNAFPHVPYLFLLCAAMAVVLALGEDEREPLTLRDRQIALAPAGTAGPVAGLSASTSTRAAGKRPS
jgi:O-antigen ligase